MTIRSPILALALAFAVQGLASAHDSEPLPPEPKHDARGHVDLKIEHRLADGGSELANPFGTPARALKLAPTAGSKTAAAYPIKYHNTTKAPGKIMPTVSKVVVIWYGNWNQANGTDNPAGQQIIRDALYGLSTAPAAGYTNYAGITTAAGSTFGKFTQADGQAVTQIASSTLVEFTQPAATAYGGTTLTDAKVLALVQAYAPTPDPNAIYLVLSSSEIAESSGFLNKYCGWHSYSTYGGATAKYAFIGNPNRSLASCAVQTVSPNGNAGVDAMVSVIAHELIETVTDPQLSAWYNAIGYENSDMCAWTFGSAVNLLPSGAYWNVKLPSDALGNSRTYLLQRQLGVSDSKCYVDATTRQQ